MRNRIILYTDDPVTVNAVRRALSDKETERIGTAQLMLPWLATTPEGRVDVTKRGRIYEVLIEDSGEMSIKKITLADL